MDPLYTTRDIARLIEVNQSTVTKWIDMGTLIAFKTPGGHRRVARKDLRSFLLKYKMPVPAELGLFRLLVLDGAKSSDGLKRALKKTAPAVQFIATTSGIEAALILAEEKPNAALLDLSVPGIDAYMLCRAVHARKHLSQIKLVTMAGLLSPEAIEKSRAAGAIECLGKPVHAAGLLALLGVPAG